MKRVNQMRTYRLGRIGDLRNIEPNEDYATFFQRTFSISEQLKSFFEDDENKRGLPNAVERAIGLRNVMVGIWKGRKVVGDDDAEVLRLLLTQFETSLSDDFQRLHTYMVDPVGAYSFDRLTGAADTVFPEDQRKNQIPEQVCGDFRAAGRCLAFDLPTACGFHVFRATDAMLRKYCDHFGAKPKSGRDWGKFIEALRDVMKNAGSGAKRPNPRTVELLDNIRAQDRNPVVHPDENLDADGALLMFDLCKNAVSLMVEDMKNSP